MRAIPAQEKERQRFADGYHDLIHDSNWADAVQRVAEWLDRQLRPSEASIAKDNGLRPAGSRNFDTISNAATA